MTSQQKRRWQFGLRWLLIAAAVSAPVVGFFGKEVQRRWEERKNAQDFEVLIETIVEALSGQPTWDEVSAPISPADDKP